VLFDTDNLPETPEFGHRAKLAWIRAKRGAGGGTWTLMGRLYTFPAGVSPGLARDCHLRFPEFEQFCIAGFPDEHSSFPGMDEEHLLGCGSFPPARTLRFSPRKMASSSPLRRMKVSSTSWRWGGGPPPGGVHVNQAIQAGGVLLGKQHRVCVANQAKVGHIRVVWIDDEELPLEVDGCFQNPSWFRFSLRTTNLSP
jgi:hypothetical protein